MRKYLIITYGCQMNEHDSERLAGMLEAMGYQKANTVSDADVLVMNTCSIREHADERFFGMLGQMKKQKKNNRDFIVCVSGCMPQQERVRKHIKEHFGWVDIIFGTHTIDKFPALLEERLSTGKKQVAILDDRNDIPLEETAKRLFKHKALVNITYGCNNFCTYCIVPYVRGREKSRSLEEVKNEVIQLAGDGVKEVMLLGQNVNSFRDSEGNTFSNLVHEINGIQGIERIRFMTSHPKDISSDLINCFKECDKLCNHIHLPVQSGSNKILMDMNRHYTREIYLDIVDKLRKAKPDIAITTDIIVGFPGETEADFEETLALVKEVEYDAAFTFIYSPREGTPAARYDNQIPDEIKHKRFDRLVEAVNKTSLKKNLLKEGEVLSVMTDGKSKKNEQVYTGRTDDFKLVNFVSDVDVIGQLVDVRITKSKSFSLDGELCMK